MTTRRRALALLAGIAAVPLLAGCHGGAGCGHGWADVAMAGALPASIETPPEPPPGAMVMEPERKTWRRIDEGWWQVYVRPRRHPDRRLISWAEVVHRFGGHNLKLSLPGSPVWVPLLATEAWEHFLPTIATEPDPAGRMAHIAVDDAAA
jgi:hypothetical protein